MKGQLAYYRKAIVAALLAALTALLTYNIPGWVSGDEDFNWRSVLAGLVAAAIAGFTVYQTRNRPPEEAFAMSYAERVVDIAEGEVGVREWGGANRGGCEKYQRPWGSWMIGQAWCGAFVAWVWTRAGMDGMHLASPSTQVMCNIARSRDLECSPRPGASFSICSVHTGLVVYAMGGGVYKTIEGNSGDAVRWRQRSLSGLVVYGPPQISGGSAEAPPAQVTWYYLEDVAMRGVREWGGWSTKAGRNGRQRIEEKRLGKQLRPFKREFPSRKSPFFFEDVSKPERFYGGWRSQEARNDAQVRLQRQLGRQLRRFSAKRAISEADADELGKID